jgi:hypothetical protein
MKLNYLIFALFYLLIGCASNLNSASIKSYQNHSINEFIKDRFTINNVVNDAINRGINIISSSKNPRDFYDYYSSSKPLPDGSYVFFAPLPGSEILERPKNDLSLFCGAKGGKLFAVAYYYTDFLSKYETNPYEAYLISVQELKQVRITSFTGSRSLTDGEINAVAMGEAMRAENINRYSDLTYARKDYFAAVKKGSFGKYNCVDHTNNLILWHVSIIPIAYKRSDKEHFISDAIYIGINGGRGA